MGDVFDPITVARLWRYQFGPWRNPLEPITDENAYLPLPGHPFTCGNRGDHPTIAGDKGILVPTTRGWICPICDYTQDWAHDHMKAAPLASTTAPVYAGEEQVRAVSGEPVASPNSPTQGLVEALEPLSNICEPDDFSDKPDGTIVLQFGLREITLGDVRRARAALSHHRASGEKEKADG